MSEVVVCETSVKLKKGDITAECTDAIVNLNNAKLNRNDGISKAILDAAGPDVKEECEYLGSTESSGPVAPDASPCPSARSSKTFKADSTESLDPVAPDARPSSSAGSSKTSEAGSTESSDSVAPDASPCPSVRSSKTCKGKRMTKNKGMCPVGFREAKLPNDGCVVTSAGDLNCHKIIHLIDVKEHNIVGAVMKALKASDENDIATISFPAMGTGVVQIKAERSIRLIMKGIEDYLCDPTVMTIISEIFIVVFEQEVYEKYQQFFQNYKTNYPHFSAFGKMIELVKGDITLHEVDCIVNLANSSLNQTSGVSGAILNAAGDTVKEECKKIGSLQADEVAITSAGKLGSKHIMHIIGPTTVPAYEPSIDRILVECHKNGFKSVALPAIGTGIARVDVEESIKAILSSILNYLSDTLIPSLESIFIIVIQESIYKKYLEVFQAKSTELQALQREERIVSAMLPGAIFSYPVTWTDIGKSEFQEVILQETSQEYKDVKDKFFKTTSASEYEIIEIKRIQNVTMWQSFTINKQSANKRNLGQKNIRHLYHGTSSDSIDNINRDGFNRVYCTVHMYGNGTYFAVESKYSCQDIYSRPDVNGKKYIYQAAVITGQHCKGENNFKEAPHIDGDPNKGRYDSVVDNVDKPKIFAVFHDDVAYPEYLITFKKR